MRCILAKPSRRQSEKGFVYFPFLLRHIPVHEPETKILREYIVDNQNMKPRFRIPSYPISLTSHIHVLASAFAL
jgi:hypothetical protein